MNRKLFAILLFLLPVALSAQSTQKLNVVSPALEDSGIYNPLWRDLDANLHFIQDANKILDEIESDAIESRNFYQLFRSHYMRVSINQQQWDKKQKVLYLDSMLHSFSQYADNQSEETTYRCLYNYVLAENLWVIGPVNKSALSTENTQLSQMELWTKNDFINATNRYLQACLNDWPLLLPLAAADFAFMLEPSVSFRNQNSMLIDLLIQHYIDDYSANVTEIPQLLDLPFLSTICPKTEKS